MKRMELSKSAWLLTTAALLTTSVIPSGMVFAADGDDEEVTAEETKPEIVLNVAYNANGYYGEDDYYSEGESVTVASGEAVKGEDGKTITGIDRYDENYSTYNFYTTAAPSPGKNGGADKIPAANKWIPIPDGTVDLESINKATTLYFAPTSTPALKDIVEVKVPAKKVLSQAKYVAKNDKAGEAAYATAAKSDEENKKTIKTKQTDIENLQASLDGQEDETEIKKIKAQISKLYEEIEALRASTAGEAYVAEMFTFKQKVGTTASDVAKKDFSTAISGIPSYNGLKRLQLFGGTIGVSLRGVSDERVDTTEADSKTGLTAYKIDDAARPSAYKTIKIAKRAAGPAVNVDYNNHVIKLKANQSYGEVDELGGVPDKWTDITAKQDVAAVAGSTYAFRNAPTDKKAGSLTTYVQFPAVQTFDADGSKAVVVGALDGDTNIGIINTKVAAKKVDYQYLLVDSLDSIFEQKEEEVTVTEKNAEGEDVETTKKVPYYAFKYGTEATSKGWAKITKKATQSSATVTVKAKKVKKYILVREAAVGTTFSSKVMIFQKPADASKAWTVVSEDDYIKDGADSLTSAKASAPALTITQKSNDAYVYTVAAKDKDNAVNKDVTISLSKAVTGVVGSTKYNYTASGTDLTLSLKKKQDAMTDSSKIDFTLPKGAAKVTIDQQPIEYPAYVVKQVTASGEANKNDEKEDSVTVKSVTANQTQKSVSSNTANQRKAAIYTFTVEFTDEISNTLDDISVTITDGNWTYELDKDSFELAENKKSIVATGVEYVNKQEGDLDADNTKATIEGIKDSKGTAIVKVTDKAVSVTNLS